MDDASPNLPQRVIASFGGLTATSKALGDVSISTVDSWARAGRIPRWRLRDIREAAERTAVPLPDDFPSIEQDVGEPA